MQLQSKNVVQFIQITRVVSQKKRAHHVQSNKHVVIRKRHTKKKQSATHTKPQTAKKKKNTDVNRFQSCKSNCNWCFCFLQNF